MYEWIVLIHIVGVLGFMFSHGISAAMALRLRHERNPDRIRVMLQISNSSLSVFYVSVVLLLGGGIAYLALWDIPAPTKPVEKVIPDERLPK